MSTTDDTTTTDVQFGPAATLNLPPLSTGITITCGQVTPASQYGPGPTASGIQGIVIQAPAQGFAGLQVYAKIMSQNGCVQPGLEVGITSGDPSWSCSLGQTNITGVGAIGSIPTPPAAFSTPLERWLILPRSGEDGGNNGFPNPTSVTPNNGTSYTAITIPGGYKITMTDVSSGGGASMTITLTSTYPTPDPDGSSN